MATGVADSLETREHAHLPLEPLQLLCVAKREGGRGVLRPGHYWEGTAQGTLVLSNNTPMDMDNLTNFLVSTQSRNHDETQRQTPSDIAESGQIVIVGSKPSTINSLAHPSYPVSLKSERNAPVASMQ